MDKALRVAIVGCGKIADAHAAQIQRIEGCEIVGVCDREPLMAKQLCERFPAGRPYANLEELLDQAKPDVVHITTPPSSHFDVATLCLNWGCHVYVEKPFVLNADDARQLIELAESRGRRLTAFDRASDGTLSGRRVWAAFEDIAPDGICLCADGTVWVSNALAHECVRVAEGGEVLERVVTSLNCYACMLGDDDRRTLYLITAVDSNASAARAARNGAIEKVRRCAGGARPARCAARSQSGRSGCGRPRRDRTRHRVTWRRRPR